MRHWRFSIHPAGGVCLLAALLFVPMERLLAAAVAMLLHEGAHLLAMRLCGVIHVSVEWTPLGFVAHAGSYPLLPKQKRLLIAAAGVAASGSAALVCLPFAGRSRFAYELLVNNLSLWLVNSLPLLPLDGSRILLALAAGAGLEEKLEKCLLLFSYLCAAALCALGLYSAFLGSFNPLLVVLGPYLAYAARCSARDSSIRGVRRLERYAARQTGMLYPAKTYVCIGAPTQAAVLRAARQCGENSCLVVHQLEKQSGKLHTTLTEAQLHRFLFQEHEMITAADGHRKMDVVQ